MGSNNVNRKQLEKMADTYGIGKLNKLEHTTRPVYTQKSDKELGSQIAGAMRNDYDIRRSMEAAQNSEDKIAEGIKGINGISTGDEAFRVHNFLQQTHEKKLGHTGKFSSANDYGNVTNYWINQEGTKTTEPEVEETKVKPQNIIDLRKDSAEAKSIIDNYNQGSLMPTPLSSDSIDRFAGIGSDNPAAGFLGNYSLNLRKDTQGPASGSTTVQPEASSAPVPQANDTSDEFTERFKSGIKSNLVKS